MLLTLESAYAVFVLGLSRKAIKMYINYPEKETTKYVLLLDPDQFYNRSKIMSMCAQFVEFMHLIYNKKVDAIPIKLKPLSLPRNFPNLPKSSDIIRGYTDN